MRYEEFTIEGRNAVLEAFRSGKPIDKPVSYTHLRVIGSSPIGPIPKQNMAE